MNLTSFSFHSSSIDGWYPLIYTVMCTCLIIESITKKANDVNYFMSSKQLTSMNAVQNQLSSISMKWKAKMSNESGSLYLSLHLFLFLPLYEHQFRVEWLVKEAIPWWMRVLGIFGFAFFLLFFWTGQCETHESSLNGALAIWCRCIEPEPNLKPKRERTRKSIIIFKQCNDENNWI